MNQIHLVVIDPQNDFCRPDGALSVPGADRDMDRLALLVHRMKAKLADIHVTLDSHRKVDISHPVWFRDRDGNTPPPFTRVTASDLRDGVWTPALPSTHARTLAYLDDLAATGRYPHTIWPEHCLIGGEGHNVVPDLFEALNEWSERFALVDFITKGSNPFTEHFSALQAEVPDPSDPGTQLNAGLLTTLEEADVILLAGEAGSHCLANTVRDIAGAFSDPSYVRKMVLLTDATSPVPGFEAYQDAFIRDMTRAGMQLSTTQDVLKSL
ncbi:MAG: hypothetical protein CVU56_14920 [Deltaproteobacteria bacterium HGW-Deltaproteobacteria-14]|jgi:nicotinamidase-related amidase|nr:MAG: hypothetical protein CVU56_14920 [Deltaproteobacteria bacterium HGW-Deltaproteobacteria-14]